MNGDSSIKFRVFSFFNQLYPFSYFDESDLKLLSEKVRIGVYKKGVLIFSIDQQPGDYFYVIKKGAVRIEQVENEVGFLIDKCGEGDFFGLRSILANDNYIYNTIAIEDSIIYEVPAKIFSDIYTRYPLASKFIISKLALHQITREKIEGQNSVTNAMVEYNPILRPFEKKDLVVADPESSIQSAIMTMSHHNVSSIIAVNNDFVPVGIITDRDIRNFVAKGYDGTRPLSTIMSSPVKCISPHTTLAEIQLSMIDSGFHHLCITRDGTNKSKCEGIVTEHDILYAGASDPVVIIKKIKSARSMQGLIEARKKMDEMISVLMQSNQNLKTMLSIIDQLNSTLIKQVVEITISGDKKLSQVVSVEHFSFYSMGSVARGEQTLLTDQDNGIIIDDAHYEFRKFYLELGKRINEQLNFVGYEFCPANMMAGNSDWCMSQSEYKKRIQDWILNPGPEEVLNTSIFFDFRHEFGNQELAQDLKNYILKNLDGQDVYLRFLASQAVSNPPPTSFFRNFVVENDGEHKDMFDLKLRVIAPLVDCARVLALKEGFLTSSNTIVRYEFLKKIDAGNVLLYERAIESFLELMRLRVEGALRNQDRFIDPKDLDKLERLKLRQCFEPIKKLQNMIERNFQIAYLR